MTSSLPVTSTFEDGVLVVRVDDGKVNALSHTAVAGLNDALDLAIAEGARALVLLGRPDKFSAGFDLKTMQADDQSLQSLVRAGAELLLRFYELPLPTVAGCTGHAMAAGALLLLSADTRVGAVGPYKIGLNEVAIGLLLPVFATELARARLSPRHLTAATLQGTLYDPPNAAEVGYLDLLAAPEELEHIALEHGHRLSELHTGAYAESKRRLRGEVVERVRATLDADIAGMRAPR